jgi:hypothetical protein
LDFLLRKLSEKIMKLLEIKEWETMASGTNFLHTSGSRRTSRLSGAIPTTSQDGEKALAQVRSFSTFGLTDFV